MRNHRAILSRLRMLRRYRGEPKNPNIMHLTITDKCNMSCPFCMYKNDNKNFNILDVKKAVSLIKEINSPVILLSGGEPLLGGEILKATREIVKICRELGKITCILTNGIKLKKIVMEDYPEFKPGARFMFQISIDGLKDEHDNQRGHFDLIMNHVQFAKKAGHLIYTNTVVSKNNIDTLHETIKFISGFSDRIYLNPMLNNNMALDTAGLKNLGDYIINHQEIRLGNSVVFGKFLKSEKQLKCMFHSLISVTPSGKIKFPCYCYGAGSEYIDSFSDYLEKVNNHRHYYEKRLAAQCRHCYAHCLHEADVYARFYLNEILEQMKRPRCFYKKYINPVTSLLS
jgi:sulfatase maturation enzyme AslB (radical SAM superfamily)